MNLLTVPRTVIRWEYQLLRYPTHLLETKVVAARLPEDSAVRLAFERILGTLDLNAGVLLADPALTAQGRTLARRSKVAAKPGVTVKPKVPAKASTLAGKAVERRERADAELKAKIARARADQKQARLDRQ